jgi:hypothetical protein
MESSDDSEESYVDTVLNSALDEIDSFEKLDDKIKRGQKRVWLEYDTNVPLHVKQTTRIEILDRTGYRVFWRKNILRIEFFTEDELREMANPTTHKKKKKRDLRCLEEMFI